VPAYYADSSALLKLIVDEPESGALLEYVRGARLVSCELALTEVPRAVQRRLVGEPDTPVEALLNDAEELLDELPLLPLEAELLTFAAALPEPALRSLDAIHLAAAIELAPLDAFVTYDVRQAAAARLSGLRTVAPGT